LVVGVVAVVGIDGSQSRILGYEKDSEDTYEKDDDYDGISCNITVRSHLAVR
jgi:hypothetical protein